MAYSLDDTIAAISTAIGEGGIGIVRMTGPAAASILGQLFAPRTSQPQSLPVPNAPMAGAWPSRGLRVESRRLTYGHIVEPATGDLVDEVLAVFMPAPQTYTRQDVVEINGHGGIVALRRILALCLEHGARLAEPGEFTARAFLNGRLDLAQAEAVLDIVRAKTDKSLNVAMGQLSGHLSKRVSSIRSLLMDTLAYLEACIDFDDEIPQRDVEPQLEQAEAELSRLLDDADRGIVYRDGIRTAIVGRPNVGKSSLLNSLLRASRAIVTEYPGTTRDTLEEILNLQGVPVVLVDTAGISAGASDPIEQLGIERSRTALAGADLALLVIDASQPVTEADVTVASLVGGKPTIVVLNKIDLLACRTGGHTILDGAPEVALSALTGAGLETLEEAILELVLSGQVAASEAPAITSPRHKQAATLALKDVGAALAAHREGLAAELVAIDLTSAVNSLGRITGQTAGDDLLETVFGSFCIGK